MVSFRYHLTSLAAVLLALAVGIVVGTTSVSASLSAEPAAPKTAPVTTASDVGAEALAQKVQSRVLKGALTDQKVLVLVAPDAPAASVRPLVTALQQSGATVTAQVRLAAGLLDASGASTVDGVVEGVAPEGLTLPATGTVERAGTELAAALVTSDQGTDISPTPALKVLGGFTGADLLTVQGPTSPVRADLVLLVAGPGHGPALAALTATFQARVGTVLVATPASALGRGSVATLRAKGTGASDVDGLGSARAVIASVLALAEQVTGGSGHYGVGPKATAVVPDVP
jgi:hypothetical protein